MSDRIILHCDCNGYYASVETLLNPALKNVPMAVAGDPEHRHGIILAKNELAKRCNVQTAEPIWQALRKCPNLVCVPPHHDKYAEISKQVNSIYLEYTDLVDPFGIDESFLDVTGTIHMFGVTPEGLADTIRERVKAEIGITISVGVSFHKVFAKLGSDYKKPDATTVITHSNVEEIVYPLPVSALLYAGKKTTGVLNRMGILTIGDLARSDRILMYNALGAQGDLLWKYANGMDNEPVRSYYEPREVKSVGNGETFSTNLVGEEQIKAGVSDLVDSVASRMRAENVKCTVVQVQIRDAQFKTISRQRTLENPTFLHKDIFETAMEIIRSSWDMESPVRMITVTGSGLIPADEVTEQLSLFDAGFEFSAKQEKIEEAMAKIRRKYGDQSIGFGK